MRIGFVTLLLVLLCSTTARADEGMWTVDGFPRRQVREKHGVDLPDAWLKRLQRASVRVGMGCSGSFVSPDGLVLTNHHCANACITKLSSAEKDYIADGFLAKDRGAELACPETEIVQLLEIEDVTGRLEKATAGLEGRAFVDAQKSEMSRIESECVGRHRDTVRCDVVSLYHGGQYHLYRYRRFQDVRLAFAPEVAIATFGGDPDNFNFPRYDLDMALLRVYQDGKPARTREHLRWSPDGPGAGEVLFVAGHPWKTARLLTVAQLEVERDLALPQHLVHLAELRGRLLEFRNRGPEEKRVAGEYLLKVENHLKVTRGRFQTLLDDRFLETKRAAEKRQRERVASDPALRGRYGGAWEDIERAMAAHRELQLELRFLEKGAAFESVLFDHARTLVRAAEERAKPSAKRLREYGDAMLPSVEQRVLSPAPIHRGLEEMLLAFSLSKMREALGADHPVVRKVLGKESPEGLARALVAGTKLADPAVRRKLWEGGAAAVRSSNDPLIDLARLVDADARAVRMRYEERVEGPVKRASERIARAEFATRGTSTYPDATGTLRISVGRVKGWVEDGRTVEPFTKLEGAFERATGKDPFRLPRSWLDAQSRLELETRFNFVTTHDVIGGNSGSPAVDAKGELGGLVFDGNIHSLGGAYWYDEEKNRTVLIHSDGILEALRVIYRADALLEEMDAPPPPRRPMRPALAPRSPR